MKVWKKGKFFPKNRPWNMKEGRDAKKKWLVRRFVGNKSNEARHKGSSRQSSQRNE